MKRPERKPCAACDAGPCSKHGKYHFNLPEVRTLADMTPAERVALVQRYGVPLMGYDAAGEPLEAPSQGKSCHDHYCNGDHPFCDATEGDPE